MTGALVNERLQKIILTYLYRKRHAGTPVVLNDLWRKHNKDYTQFRITLQYLFKDKEYIWSQNHRDIVNTYNGEKKTLDNVTVSAKITEKGIEFYRKEYRDEFFKYWGLRLPIIATVLTALGWAINTFIINPAGKSTTQPQNIINQNPVINSKNSDSAKQTINFNQATQTNSNNGDVVNGNKIINNSTVIINNPKLVKPKPRQLTEQNISLIVNKVPKDYIVSIDYCYKNEECTNFANAIAEKLVLLGYTLERSVYGTMMGGDEPIYPFKITLDKENKRAEILIYNL